MFYLEYKSNSKSGKKYMMETDDAVKIVDHELGDTGVEVLVKDSLKIQQTRHDQIKGVS